MFAKKKVLTNIPHELFLKNHLNTILGHKVKQHFKMDNIP